MFKEVKIKKFNLPYFDLILSEIEKQNKDMEQVFGEHIHWGYWENPKLANGSIEDFQHATKALSKKLLELASIVDGKEVLEVGCGFGGTISLINDEFHNLKIVGVNIDQRQIDRAKEKVFEKNGNDLSFIQGDACKLPFNDNSFDIVLAVECIFHFSDRNKFFSEANRVLKDGGRLVLSDFVLSFNFPKLFNVSLKKSGIPFYGNIQLCTCEAYESLAKSNRFEIEEIEDINDSTLPTYPIVKKVFSKSKMGYLLTQVAELTQKSKMIRYKNFSFKKI